MSSSVFAFVDLVRLISLAIAAMALVVAAYIDFRRFIIPNLITFVVLLSGAVYAILTPHFSWGEHLGICLALFFAGALLFQFRLFGGGDVKLLAALGFWSGLENIFSLLLIMSFAGGVLALLYLLKTYWSMRGAKAEKSINIMEKATILHAQAVTEGAKAVLTEVRQSDAFKQPIPYGVAIALGGLYVFVIIAGQIGGMVGQ